MRYPVLAPLWLFSLCVYGAGCGSQQRPTIESDSPLSGSSGDAVSSSLDVMGKPPMAMPDDFEVAITSALSPEEVRDGWISLFDDASLFGWDVPSGTNWHVEDQSIVADTGEKSLLLTPFELDDFELRCDFHLVKGGNSGIFLRTADKAANPATDTYELNICDQHPTHGSGSLVGRLAMANVPPVEGEWHTFRVLCEGLHIQVWLDGKQIVDFTDESAAPRLTGKLGLQMNQGRAAYRNIFVRPLKFQSLLNGTDTVGWRSVPGSRSAFNVTDGLLHMAGGPGFLETENVYGNFALKVEARINGESLNSGVFFRAKTGTEEAPSHGYEMQLHNGFKDGDRSKPVDYGTGAIFRRVPARYVVANDREFFTAVLIAQHAHFSSWVNGVQVVSWQDTRQPNENPREGLRLEAGHFSLQGHDSTTDLDFRAFDVHEFLVSPHQAE